jgi:S-adenosylmethionine synthetase
MTKTAIVTGATGLLGRQVLQAFQENGWKAVGTGFSRSGPSIRKLDLTDSSATAALLDEVKYEKCSLCWTAP